MDKRRRLRLAAELLVAAVVVSLLAGLLHADVPDSNNHVAAFTAYAASDVWTFAHLGQFVGIALFTGGLFVLLPALIVRPGLLAVTARFGGLAAATALALYGALQAVDGVALKQAVDAWAAADEADQPLRFATAEGIRWLEWGMRSYYSFVLGTALILFGIAVAAGRVVPAAIGYLMGLSGLAYLAQGWIIGSYGFAAANTWPTLIGIVATIAWTVWLLISAFRMKPAR